jgi:hypothetical protein
MKPFAPGRQTLLQQLSHRAHGEPAGRQAPPALGTQRETPSPVLMQLALPPVQQFCDAPSPPHTSPSGWQFCAFAQRRTPSPSGVPHDPEQHCLSPVHTSS